jgi:Na+/proline symporter
MFGEGDAKMLDLQLMSPGLGYVYLSVFLVVYVIITASVARLLGRATVDSFLVANRKVPWWIAGPSIAAGWTQAIALMISVQTSYENGFAGIFWFTVPNVIAVLVFIWLGPKIREKIPNGYSLPEWMFVRFSDARVTWIYIFVYFYYQVMTCAVQIYAGGSLLSAATGISAYILMPLVLIMTLLYCIVSGLQASLVTDFIQLSGLLLVGGTVITLVVRASGGEVNLEGVTGVGGLNPFDYRIALTAGVIQSIGLISGAIGDQPFWQRCLAVRRDQIRLSFLFGALLFAVIPIGLALLGFTAAAPKVGLILPANFDRSLVGFAIVKRLLAPGVATLFIFLLLAALCSSLDSALVASSSLYKLVRTQPWSARTEGNFSVLEGRIAMVAIGLIGLLIGVMVKAVPSLDLKYLWWFLNTIGACVVVPTVLSLFWDRLSASGIIIGSVAGLTVGLPLVVYAGVNGYNFLLAGTYFGVLLVSLLSCYFTAVPLQPKIRPMANQI